MADEAQTTEVVQDPVSTPDPTVTAPVVPTPAPSAGPWDQSLSTRFTDESVRGQVAAYLREEIQPYTTRLEQQAHTNEQALNLWNNFESDPINTYVQITHELLGEENANWLLEQMQQRVATQEEQQPEQTQEVQQPMALSPEDQQVLAWARSQQQASVYNEELARVMAQPENQDLVDAKGKDGSSAFEHIAPFVHSAGGDFDRATAMLRSFVQQWGVPSAAPVTPEEPAPNALGSDSTAQTGATETVQPNLSLNESIDEWMREQRELRNAPPMGAV